MNIHPIFVHFPIAFLNLYAFFEVVRIKSWQQSAWIKPLKTIVVIIGVVFAYVSLSTGEAAEHLLSDGRIQALVEKHSFFADVTTYLFLVPAVAYLFECITSSSFSAKIPSVLLRVMNWYATKIAITPVRIICAVLGTVAVFIVGALGGAIVYGPATDPVVWFVYNLFFSF